MSSATEAGTFSGSGFACSSAPGPASRSTLLWHRGTRRVVNQAVNTKFLLAPANAPFMCEGPFFLTMQALCNLLMIDATNALRQLNSSHSSSNPAPEVQQIVSSKARNTITSLRIG